EKSIIETLGYRSVFSYPLSFHQLGTSLICDKKVSSAALRVSLKRLLKEKKVKRQDYKYCLYSVEPVSWGERIENSKTLMKKAQKLSSTLSKIPWIEFIGVTGSVAAANALDNDDIDLFFVTKRNRLWLSRGFVFLILVILGELSRGSHDN